MTMDLPGRLRRETAEAHRNAEASLGLPAAVASRDDYAALLTRLADFHAGVEIALADPRWASDWLTVGIDLADHNRSNLLEDDLRCLAHSVPPSCAWPDPESFAEALGLLYVVEGSSLGGRILGPMIRSTLGNVPTRYYDGDGRGHPRPWRSVQAALRLYAEADGDQAQVIRGAQDAFVRLGKHLASPIWSAVR